jgi:hypothetical protein
MNHSSIPLWPWLLTILLFLASVWLVLAPTWMGYHLTTSDWVTAAVLDGSAFGLGFWSLALITPKGDEHDANS